MNQPSTYRLAKRISGHELLFLTPDEKNVYLKFDLAALRQLVQENGQIETALTVCRALEATVGFRLTPQEIEFAVEDI